MKNFRQHSWCAALLRRLCIAFGLAALWLPACANAGAALEILAEDAAAPWSQRDGSGVAVDIVKAAFAAVDVPVTLRAVAYARCKHMVMTGQVAACFSMSADASLEGKVIFPTAPLYRNYVQYFHNPQRPLHAASEADIRKGSVIGIVDGYEYPPSVAALQQRGVILEAAGSEAANLKKLAAGRIDGVVVNLDEMKSAAFLIERAGVDRQVAPLFRTSDFGTYLGFSVVHPQGIWARDKFNEGFEKIRADGSLEMILSAWRARLQS